MDAAQWTTTTTHQGIGVVVKDSSTATSLQLHQGDDNNINNNKRIRPNYKEQALNCPRCNSSNTKFCYYNNYSLSQPRYFCKTCRRYWTDGGSLRNVPVGGGSRKNKRPASSSTSSVSSAAFPSPSNLVVPIPPIIPLLPGSDFYDQGGQDLNLCFAKVPPLAHYGFAPAPESCPGFGAAGFGFQELMRQSNMKLPGTTMQEGGTGRLLFPFEDLRQVQMSNGGAREDPQNGAVAQQAHDPSLFW